MLLIEILCRRKRVVLQVGLWLGKSQVMFLCIILLPYDHTQWSGTWGFRLRNSILGYLQFHTYLYPNYLNLIPFKNLSYSNAIFDTLKTCIFQFEAKIAIFSHLKDIDSLKMVC